MARVKYDIVVWIDQDGDVVCSSYTDGGHACLRDIVPTYEPGQILEILAQPEEFRKHVPPTIKVGLKNPKTNKVTRMAPLPLH